MLFKTSDEIKRYLPANAAFEFDQIKPFIERQGEPELIIPAIGQAQYDLLNTAYNTNKLSPSLEKLLDKVRFALANFAYVKYIPFAQLSISASGIHIEVNDEKKTAFEWQINKLEESCRESAYNGIEQLLEFMEANKSDYEAWTESDSYTVFKDCFIYTATEFSKYFNIGRSRSTFLAIKATMQRIEEFYLEPILGLTTFEAIKDQIKAGAIAAEMVDLLRYIRPAVANLTMARALTELPLRITPNGVHLITSSITNNATVKMPAPDTRLAALQIQAQQDGENYLKLLEKFLYDHVDDYADWQEDGSYVDPESDEAEPWDQSDNGVVIF